MTVASLVSGKPFMRLIPTLLRNTQPPLIAPTGAAAASSVERIILYSLGEQHLFFDRDSRCLYFPDLERTPVLPVLKKLGTEQQASFKLISLYLDTQHYFFAGYRAHLPEPACKPALVALRLKGVTISNEVPRYNEENPAYIDNPWFRGR